MIEPVEVTPDRLFDFVGERGESVLFLSVHALHAFNGALAHELQGSAATGEPMALGTMDLTELLFSGGAALPFLQRGLEGCGAPSMPVLGVVPGYFLFRAGEMLAWDSGLPTRADFRHLAEGALLGAIWSGATQNVAFLAHGIRVAAERVAAHRIATSFRTAAATPSSPREWSTSSSSSSSASGSSWWWSRARSARRGGAATEGDLFWAYRVLGVSPASTDAEIHDAWRSRRLETHPDHAAGDPAEFARRSVMAAEINRAREIIFSSRRGRRATA